MSDSTQDRLDQAREDFDAAHEYIELLERERRIREREGQGQS